MTTQTWRPDYAAGQPCRCQHHPINHAYDKGGIRGRCLAQAEKCPCARYQPNEEGK